MNTLKDIATHSHFSINHLCSLKEAMTQMNQNKDGSVVLLKDSLPIAILTESDIVNGFKKDINLNDRAYKFATKHVIYTHENRPIEFAFNFLSEHNIRRIVLVDDEEKFAGIVMQEDLFDYLEEDVYKVDLKISHIIKTNQNIITVKEDDLLSYALKLMQKHHIGSIVVTNGLTFSGILTEKDILKLTYFEVNMEEKISLHMSKPVISIDKDSLVTEVIELMKRKMIRRVLVTDQDKNLIAILTNRDILKHIKGNYSRILQLKIKHAQEIMDFLPEAILELFIDNTHQIIYWMNKKAKEFFGKDLIDKEVTTIFSVEDWSDIYNSFQISSAIVNKRVNINNQIFEISGTLSKNLNNRYIKLIFKDVTEHESTKKKLQLEIDRQIEKRLENEYLLMQQSKLATMGEMIGHIAHQWRQPLAQLGGIFMNLDAADDFKELTRTYLKKKTKKGNELIKYMSHTIDDFRHFFEPNRTKKRFELSKYIQSAVNIIEASLTYYHIELQIITPKEPIFIFGYPSEFAQVVLNLLDNAKDVLIERKIQNPKIKIETKIEKNEVIIQIQDNGGGIDDKNIDKIFDIYFTTKAKTGGSGLGLYMSKLIIESKEMGEISVKNTQLGALFFIKLQKI
jgi:CBS domain-containing protein/signal transduction histidine kinase